MGSLSAVAMVACLRWLPKAAMPRANAVGKASWKLSARAMPRQRATGVFVFFVARMINCFRTPKAQKEKYGAD